MNDVRFVISGEEDLASGLGTRLAFVRQKFYYSEKRTEKASDTDLRRETESAPHASLIKAIYTFTRPTPQHTS